MIRRVRGARIARKLLPRGCPDTLLIILHDLLASEVELGKALFGHTRRILAGYADPTISAPIRILCRVSLCVADGVNQVSTSP